MTREEFSIIAKALKAVYADPKFLPDGNALDVWYALLQDLEYEKAHIAVQSYMMTAKFPPSIADIIERVAEITRPEEVCMNELEAWSIVQKAICNSAYHADEEFEKLPEVCKKAVGRAANLREWAGLDSDRVNTVEQSHFIRNFRTTVEKMNREAMIPQPMRARIESIREMALLPG